MKFIQKEFNKMGLKMNNNKREILVFGKTDEIELEGRIVRAHNALAYCWLFCFLRLGLFLGYFYFSFFSFLSKYSFSQTRRAIATKFNLHRDQKLL